MFKRLSKLNAAMDKVKKMHEGIININKEITEIMVLRSTITEKKNAADKFTSRSEQKGEGEKKEET